MRKGPGTDEMYCVLLLCGRRIFMRELFSFNWLSDLVEIQVRLIIVCGVIMYRWRP